jgi:carbon starvation protein CstA
MRFSVPQFIDVEDKIFGPLTLKQGIYLVGSAGAAYFIFSFFGMWGLLLVGIPLVLLAVLLAFIKVNNRPFVVVASAAFFYALKKKLYLWKKTPKKTSTQTTLSASQQSSAQPMPQELTQSRLRALAFSLDTEEGYQAENQ